MLAVQTSSINPICQINKRRPRTTFLEVFPSYRPHGRYSWLSQQACSSSVRTNWIASKDDGWKPGNLMAHYPDLDLWVFIPIIGSRPMHLDDNLLPTRGFPEVTGWGKKLQACSQQAWVLSPEAPLWDHRTRTSTCLPPHPHTQANAGSDVHPGGCPHSSETAKKLPFLLFLRNQRLMGS